MVGARREGNPAAQTEGTALFDSDAGAATEWVPSAGHSSVNQVLPAFRR
jgi:hypothetical protein